MLLWSFWQTFILWTLLSIIYLLFCKYKELLKWKSMSPFECLLLQCNNSKNPKRLVIVGCAVFCRYRETIAQKIDVCFFKSAWEFRVPRTGSWNLRYVGPDLQACWWHEAIRENHVSEEKTSENSLCMVCPILVLSWHQSWEHADFLWAFLGQQILGYLTRPSTLCVGVCASEEKQPSAYLELELHSSWDKPPCHY